LSAFQGLGRDGLMGRHGRGKENDIQARNIADPDTVKMSDLQRSVLFATVEAVSTQLMNPTRHTAITLAEWETGNQTYSLTVLSRQHTSH
jgi:hypothetical protein